MMDKIKIFMLMSFSSVSLFAQEGALPVRTVMVRCLSEIALHSHKMESVHNDNCDSCNDDICNNGTCGLEIQKKYRIFNVEGNTLRIKSRYKGEGESGSRHQHSSIILDNNTQRVDLKPKLQRCESVGARVEYEVTEHKDDDHDDDDDDEITNRCPIL